MEKKEENSEACGFPSTSSEETNKPNVSLENKSIVVTVTPTTGGQFELPVVLTDTIDSLKKSISKKLKVSKDRICLLHRDRQLQNGTLEENKLVDGSRLTLLPSVETGLMIQRPEQSVMQALENLSDSQVNDFLSGKSPLNLTMRLGDHMMLIQLQLSTLADKNKGRVIPTVSTVPVKRKITDENNVKDETEPPIKLLKQREGSGDKIEDAGGCISKDISVSTLDASVEVAENKNCNSIKNVVLSSSPSAECASSSSSSSPTCSCQATPLNPIKTNNLDTRALAEASKNLTQTLKQLSSEVLTTKKNTTEEGADDTKSRQGAIIESMQHHGKGVYSGTFSGTLNPALQDRHGRPKRHISTIIHILNDLLCATPQACVVSCRGASPNKATAATTSNAANTATTSSFRSDASDTQRLPTFQETTEPKENAATRDKMERLRSIMEERREKRKATRNLIYKNLTTEQSTPLIGQWSAKSETSSMETADTETVVVCSEPVTA